jgi:hypothetical protein
MLITKTMLITKATSEILREILPLPPITNAGLRTWTNVNYPIIKVTHGAYTTKITTSMLV